MQPLGSHGVRGGSLAEPIQPLASIGFKADVAVQVNARQHPLRLGVSAPCSGFQTLEVQRAEGVLPAQVPQLTAQGKKAFAIRLGEQLRDVAFRAGDIEFPRLLIFTERNAVHAAGGAEQGAFIGIVQIEEGQREFGHQVAAGGK